MPIILNSKILIIINSTITAIFIAIAGVIRIIAISIAKESINFIRFFFFHFQFLIYFKFLIFIFLSNFKFRVFFSHFLHYYFFSFNFIINSMKRPCLMIEN
jgi:hypothetical protein